MTLNPIIRSKYNSFEISFNFYECYVHVYRFLSETPDIGYFLILFVISLFHLIRNRFSTVY